MKKDTEKIIRHISEHPNDANAVISLLKIKSDNIFHDLELGRIRKVERMRARKKKVN